MAAILVNIVRAQTIPNFLFIKEYGIGADLFLFIITEEMEQAGKTEAIVSVCKRTLYTLVINTILLVSLLKFAAKKSVCIVKMLIFNPINTSTLLNADLSKEKKYHTKKNYFRYLKIIPNG